MASYSLSAKNIVKRSIGDGGNLDVPEH